MLSWLDTIQVGCVPLVQVGERLEILEAAMLPVLGGLPIEPGESVELDHRTSGSESIMRSVPRCEVEVHGRGVVNRWRHLAGDETEPDELVEASLLLVQVATRLIRVQFGIGGPDRLVGFLCALLLLPGPELRSRREILLPECTRHPAACSLGGFRRHPGGVGPHVSDQPHRAPISDLDSLVETLGRAHGPPCREAQPLRRLLLKRRGGERGRRILPALAPLHIGGGERESAYVGEDGRGCRLVSQGEGLAPDLVEPGLEWLVVLLQVRGDRPVFFGNEGPDFVLALTDQPERHSLDPPGGESRANGLPEEGRDLVPDQAIQHPAGLLGLDLLHVQNTRILQRPRHGGLRDLAELHPLEALRMLRKPEVVRHMEGNRLALAIRVCRQDDGVGAPRLPLQLLQDLRLPANGDVVRLESVLDIDSQLLRREIANMPHGGCHVESSPEVAPDRPGLRRGFHDDEVPGALSVALRHAAPVTLDETSRAATSLTLEGAAPGPSSDGSR